jgi:hypothetical protein
MEKYGIKKGKYSKNTFKKRFKKEEENKQKRKKTYSNEKKIEEG